MKGGQADPLWLCAWHPRGCRDPWATRMGGPWGQACMHWIHGGVHAVQHSFTWGIRMQRAARCKKPSGGLMCGPCNCGLVHLFLVKRAKTRQRQGQVRGSRGASRIKAFHVKQVCVCVGCVWLYAAHLKQSTGCSYAKLAKAMEALWPVAPRHRSEEHARKHWPRAAAQWGHHTLRACPSTDHMTSDSWQHGDMLAAVWLHIQYG